MTQALKLAQQELQAAQASDASGPALARARAWDAALREAASGALPQDGDVVVTEKAAGAELMRARRTLPLRTGLLLRESDEVATGEGAAELRFHDGSILDLAPKSRLRVVQAPRSFPEQSAFELTRGALYWVGSAVSPGQLRVATPRASARFGAGRAELALDADGVARLSIHEGSAELSARPGPGTPPARWWEEVFPAKLDKR